MNRPQTSLPGERAMHETILTEFAMKEFRMIFSRLKDTGRLMIGVPCYDTYVAHRLANHPDEPIMTYEEFFRDRQNARYGVKGGGMNRCC
jgi:uncharacterized short protein YbdD (DUF466 family)